MTLIDWKDEFEVGIAEMDRDHRTLIGLVNRLHERLGYDPGAIEVDRFMDDLRNAITHHFVLEETVMRDLSYDGFAAHKTEHDDLLGELDEIMEVHWWEGVEGWNAAVTRKLDDWFTAHFKRMDVPLHNFAAQKDA